MSRSDESGVQKTAEDQNKVSNATATTAEKNEAADIGGYKSALAKYAADNPFVQGGEFDTASGKAIANTGDAVASSAKGALQDQALRTGQNPAAANAAAEEIARNAQRTMSGEQADATKTRIAGEEGHDQQVLSGTEAIPGLSDRLAATAGGQATAQLGIRERAAEQPSFMDEFGGSLAKGLAGLATGQTVKGWAV